MNAMGVLRCNGQWIESGVLPLEAMDRGMMLGMGLFETILALDGRPVFLERHLDRLRKSCLGMGWWIEEEGLEETMRELLARNGLGEGRARIRLAVTAGSGKVDNLRMGKDGLRWMTACRAEEAPAAVAVNIASWRRNERSPLAGLKCASYAENLVALDHSRRAGFQETLFFNTANQLCEAAMANVFLVRKGVILTPGVESGCLPGVTRQVVLELARDKGLEHEEKVLRRADLERAEEIFLTSAVRGPVPVSRCGDRSLGEARIGAVVREWWLEAVRGA